MTQSGIYKGYYGAYQYAISLTTSGSILLQGKTNAIILQLPTHPGKAAPSGNLCLKYNHISNILMAYNTTNSVVYFIPLKPLTPYLTPVSIDSDIKWVSHGATVYGNTAPSGSGGCVKVTADPRRGTAEYNFADSEWYNYPYPDDGCLCTQQNNYTVDWWVMASRWPNHGGEAIHNYYISDTLLWSGYVPTGSSTETVFASGSIPYTPQYTTTTCTTYGTDNNVTSCNVDYFTGDMYAFCNSSSTKTIYRFNSSGVYQGVYGVYAFSSIPGYRHGSFIPYDANWIHIPQERWQYKVQKNPIATWDGSWTYFDPWISSGWPCQIDAAYNSDKSVRSVYTMALSSRGMRGYPYNKTTGAFSTQTSSYGCATYGQYGTNTWVVNDDYMIYQSGNFLYAINTLTGSTSAISSFPYVIRNISASKSVNTRTAIITTTANVFEYNPYTNTLTTIYDYTNAFFAVSLK